MDKQLVARSLLANEWATKNPKTPEEIAAFYRTSKFMPADLECFHDSPERQRWTEVIKHLIQDNNLDRVLDIGCGAGHDLMAYKQDYPNIMAMGVEPNEGFRSELNAKDVLVVYDDVAKAPLETMQSGVVTCFDVLEHIYDPETWLAEIAMRLPVGVLFAETCATFDIGTPLHLESNYGWKPGRVLERSGFQCVMESGRLRVWERTQLEPVTHTYLTLCAHRTVTLQTLSSIVRLVGSGGSNWRIGTYAEAAISRSRSRAVSTWWSDTNGDVLLFVDDDIVFKPEDAQRITELCRNGHDIICAAYPVRDGSSFAFYPGEGVSQLVLGDGLPPLKIKYGATGFMALSRRVIDALVPTLPLCHANSVSSFWPFFDFQAVPDPTVGGYNYLSEDYYFSYIAKKAGFDTWLDPSILLGHIGQIEVNTKNMRDVHYLSLGGYTNG